MAKKTPKVMLLDKLVFPRTLGVAKKALYSPFSQSQNLPRTLMIEQYLIMGAYNPVDTKLCVSYSSFSLFRVYLRLVCWQLIVLKKFPVKHNPLVNLQRFRNPKMISLRSRAA